MGNALDILDSENARFNFMKGIIKLAKVNGIDATENVFYEHAMLRLHIGNDDKAVLEKLMVDDSDIDVEFTAKKQALFFLREGIQLCCVDGHYDNSEKELVREMASKLGISLHSIERIEEWVFEGVLWSQRGDTLLSLEG